MGYYTQYSLMQLRNPIPDHALAKLIAEDQCAVAALNLDGDSRRPEKWYEHEASLCVWSALYPDTVFCLHAEGEDSDGIWDKYFLGGCLARTEILGGLPEIDLDQLARKDAN